MVKSLTVRVPHTSFERVTVKVSPIFAWVTRGWLAKSTETGKRLVGNGGLVIDSAMTLPALRVNCLVTKY